MQSSLFCECKSKTSLKLALCNICGKKKILKTRESANGKVSTPALEIVPKIAGAKDDNQRRTSISPKHYYRRSKSFDLDSLKSTKSERIINEYQEYSNFRFSQLKYFGVQNPSEYLLNRGVVPNTINKLLSIDTTESVPFSQPKTSV